MDVVRTSVRLLRCSGRAEFAYESESAFLDFIVKSSPPAVVWSKIQTPNSSAIGSILIMSLFTVFFMDFVVAIPRLEGPLSPGEDCVPLMLSEETCGKFFFVFSKLMPMPRVIECISPLLTAYVVRSVAAF